MCRGSPANRVQTVYSRYSSFGLYCMMFLEFYMHAQFCWKWARHLRPMVQFFLLAFALYVGYPLGSDHKHHWSDVLIGLLQGAPFPFKSWPPMGCLEEELESKPRLLLTLTLGEADCNYHGYQSVPPEIGPVCVSSQGSGCASSCSWPWQGPPLGGGMRALDKLQVLHASCGRGFR